MDRKEISLIVFRPNFFKIGLFGLGCEYPSVFLIFVRKYVVFAATRWFIATETMVVRNVFAKAQYLQAFFVHMQCFDFWPVFNVHCFVLVCRRNPYNVPYFGNIFTRTLECPFRWCSRPTSTGLPGPVVYSHCRPPTNGTGRYIAFSAPVCLHFFYWFKIAETMFLTSMQKHCIYLSFCLITQRYWVPNGTKPVIIELHDLTMKLHNSYMEFHDSSYYSLSSTDHYGAPRLVRSSMIWCIELHHKSSTLKWGSMMVYSSYLFH